MSKKLVAKMANKFLNLRNQDMQDQERLQKLAFLTTQSYFEGEAKALYKRNRLGITEKYQYKHDNIDKKADHHTIDYREDGPICAARYEQPMKMKRTFFQNGRKIGQAKDKRFVRMMMYQPATKDQKAACPNCGAYAPIDTYVDGCDYCHSKFQVSDFEMKVSGFSTYFNLSRQNNIPFFILLILTALCWSGANDLPDARGPVYTTIAVGLYILCCMISWGMYAYARKRHKIYLHEENLEKVMPKNKIVEFAQNIEQRIKYMIYAENGLEATAFTECNMNAFLAAHQNVIDVDVEQLDFEDAQYSPDGQWVFVKLSAKIVNYCFENGKVKKKCETLHLDVVEANQILQAPARPLRRMSCENCGNPINIFHGGVCEYCQTQQNKYALGWVIRQVSFEERSDNKYHFLNACCYAFWIILMFVLYSVIMIQVPR